MDCDWDIVSLRSIRVKTVHPVVNPGVQDQKYAYAISIAPENSDAIATGGRILSGNSSPDKQFLGVN
jgi:hypothetical protein